MVTKTWNGANANWTTVADWTPTGQPASGDAVVVSSGQVNITSNVGTVNSVADSANVSLSDGGLLTTTLGFTNSSGLYVDDGYQLGGSELAVGGALVNSGSLGIGGGNSATGASTVTAGSLTNFINTVYGTISLNGDVTAALESTLNVASAAGAGAAGVIYGSINLSGHSVLEFANSEINTIAGNSELTLSGQNAFVADAGSLTSNSALTGLTTVSGALNLVGTAGSTGGGGVNFATTSAVSVSGTFNVDNGYQQGGSVATIGGANSTPYAAISISGSLNIGGGGTEQGTTTVKTSGVTNYIGTTLGTINLNSSAGQLVQLDVTGGLAGFGVAGSIYGNVNMSGDSLIEFQNAQISTIAAQSELTLNGPAAVVADATALTSNSALTGLATITGSLNMLNGSVVTTTGAMAITGSVNVDYGYQQGGSTLQIGGGGGAAISNSGSLQIGGGGTQTAATNVGAASVTNYVGTTLGTININGNATNSLRATLTLTGAAGFGVAGRLYGNVNLSGDALLDFGSSQINMIATASELSLNGPSAYLASGSSVTSNSGLTGLTNVSGTLNMANGAVVSTSAALTIVGAVNVDYGYQQGGSALTIGVGANATITNEGYLQVGGGGAATGSSTVAASGLTNVGGTITLSGNSGSPIPETATLNLGSAAGLNGAGQLVGNVNLSGYSLLEFASGEINTIGANSELTVSSAHAFVAHSGALTSNSALTGLTTVIGSLYVDSGASVTTSSLTITGLVNVDDGYQQGGSTLTVTNGVVNSGNLLIGAGGSATGSSTVNVGSLTNVSGATYGTVNLSGNGGAPVPTIATLNIGAAAGPLVGNVNLSGYALLEYATGEVTSIASGSELTISGANAYVANQSNLTGNSALTGLTTITGAFYIQSGATVTTNQGVTVTGTLNVDDGYQQGKSTLTVGGALAINGGGFQIGAGGSSTGATTVNASSVINSGGVFINTTGALDLGSGAYAQSGGSTNVEGRLTGSIELSGGMFEIAAGAAVTGSIGFTGGGATLQLDQPSAFTLPVSGFTTGDTVVLVGVSGNAATVNGSNQLVVTENGTAVDTLQLSGSNAGYIYLTVSQSGNTLVTALSTKPTVAQFLLFKADYDQIPGQFVVTDTAANVAANLDALSSDSSVTAITLTDDGTPAMTLTTTQLANDTAGLNKITNPLFEALVGTSAYYYAGGNGATGTPISLVANNAHVNEKANSNVHLTGNSDEVSVGASSVLSVSGSGDAITGSSMTIIETSAQVNLTGGSDTVYFSGGAGNSVSLYGVSGAGDTVYGSGGSIALIGEQVSVVGGGDTIYFYSGSGNSAGLYDTSGVGDTVYGSNGTVYLNDAQTSVVGGGDTIYYYGGSGNSVILYDTSGVGDTVYGSNGSVYLNDAQASIVGGGDIVYFYGSSGNSASLYGEGGVGDTVYGSGGSIALIGEQASVVGGGDTIYFYSGSGNSAGLYDTSGVGDTVYGSNGTVYLNDAQTSVVGGGDTIYYYGGAGNTANLFGTGASWDTVYGSSGSVTLTSAQVSLLGGGDAVYFSGGTGNIASLYDTNSAWDTVYGANGTVALTSAQSNVIGSGNTIDFSGTGNYVSASGGSEAFVFQPSIGQDTINGFAASDSMTFSASDFANFAALSPHISQSGSNTLISLDANDTITLTNTLASSLTSSQFHFV